MSTTVWSDNCTGTDGNNAITSSPSAGSVNATYSARPGNESLLLIKSNRYYSDGSNDGYTVLQPTSPGQPTTADYRTTFNLFCVSPDTTKFRLYARYDGSGSGNGYYVQDDGSVLSIIKIVNGVESTLASGFYTSLTTGDSGVLAFDITGSTLTALYNGVTIATATDSTHTGIGTVLAVFQGHASSTQGTHLDSLTCVDSSTGGAASKLGMSVQPSGGTTTVALGTQPVVLVQEAGGSTVTGDTSSVVATLNAVSGSGTLGGTTTKAAVAGVATFTNLAVTSSGGGVFTLTFTDGSLTSTTSASFTIVGTAAKLGFSAQPGATANTNRAFAVQPTGHIQDAAGSTIADSIATVTASVNFSSGSGALIGTTSVNAVAGAWAFTDLGVIATDRATYIVSFASSGLTGVSSVEITNTVISNDGAVTTTA